ncbi:MAG: hypothetical protein M3R68_05770 [Acidobacteriota bacterium]|nr:hypothetical protein [Acidobacteriota bacterium]
MRKAMQATALLLFALIFANAQVPQPCRVQDQVRGCSANGRPGQQRCDGREWGYCKPTGQPPPPPLPKAFDLLWDTEDSNGIPLNAKWSWQVYAGKVPNPAQCPDGPFSSLCMTGPDRVTFDTADICNAAEIFGRGNALYGVAGHANWSPATYVGRLTWEAHSHPCDTWSGLSSLSCDDDYNFNLYTPNNAGLTTARDSIECEFDSDETIDHFDTPWWNSFHNAVDNSVDDLQINESFFKERGELGRYAIVTGLLGLEMIHGGSPELHPIWAMAIRVKDDDPADEVWAIFIRRWGNEGFCSADQHYLQALPDNTYTFLLPWRPGASDVRFGAATTLKANYPFTVTPQAIPNQGLLVSFPAPLAGENRINGELHLQWPGGKWGQPAPIPAPMPGKPLTCEQQCQGDCFEFRRGTTRYNQCLGPCQQECQRTGRERTEPSEPERIVGLAVSKMSLAQRQEIARLTPTPPISHDQQAGRLNAITRIASLPKNRARPSTAKFTSAPDARKKARNQRLLDSVRKIRGKSRIL